MTTNLVLASSRSGSIVDRSVPFDCVADDPSLSTLKAVPAGMTPWRFVEALADWTAGDARKITLLQAVRLTEGRQGAVIDLDALTARLERERDTVAQHLNALEAEGWVSIHGRRTTAGRWANEYRLAQSVGSDG